MSGFIYFIDGWVNPITDDVIARSSLRYAFDASPAYAPIHGRTPSGGPGTLVADKHRVDNLAFDGEKQAWHKRPPFPATAAGQPHNVYVGHWKSSAPLPKQLARVEQIAGERVVLADRRAWQVPRLLVHGGEAGFQYDLPRYVDMNDEGRLVRGDVVDECQPAADLAERVLNLLRVGGDTEEVIRTSVEVLQLNYALSLFEATKILRLFRDDDAEVVKTVLRSAGDWARFEAWYQKKTKESSPAVSTG